MAILPILCYPDPRLHKVAQPVQAVDERVRAILDDMLATMYDANGIGLAATQVDIHERIVVIEKAGELRPDHPHVVTLLERPANVDGAGEVPLARLWHAVPAYPTISELWLRWLEAYGRPR